MSIRGLAHTVTASLLGGLRHQRRHVATTLLLATGLAPPVAVAAGISLYTDAASGRLLAEQIDDADTGDSYLFSFNRLSGGSRDWNEVAKLDASLLDESLAPIPVGDRHRFIETNSFSLIIDDQPEPRELGSVTFSSSTDFSADTVGTALQLRSGSFPEPAAAGDPIEVLVESVFADDEAVSTGTEFVALGRAGERLSVVVSGIWTDGPGARAFGDADSYRRRLLVPDGTITDFVSPASADAIQNVRWRVDLDPTQIRSDDVDAILAASDRLEAQANNELSGTRLLSNPNGPLREFQSQQRSLERGLAGFSLPLLALAGAVALLLVTISIRSRATEIRIARRRGRPRWVLMVRFAGESIVVTTIAVVLGLAGAFAVASVIGRTTTFFRFGDADGLTFVLTRSVWATAGWAALAVVAIQLLPAASAIAREPTRAGPVGNGRPWWQRQYLDLALIVLVAVITWRGVRSSSEAADLLDDPAVILLPSAAALGVGLSMLRLMPLLMRGVAAVLARGERTASLLAARRAARVPADISAPLLLLIITASLATFTASLAVTLDLQLLDDTHHRIGAEARIVDSGVGAPARRPAPNDDASIPGTPPTVTRHADLADYADVWGVERATALIELIGTGSTPTQSIPGLLFNGVDPASFAQTAFWRSDYSDDPLDEMMSRLAADPSGVLISNELARSAGVGRGETLRLELNSAGGTVTLDAIVQGGFDQFPLWFPERETPLVVGRADTIEALAGATHERTVLFVPGDTFADSARVTNDLAGIGADASAASIAARSVDVARRDPGRQGVLGLLTVGVGLATLLTLAGFIVSTIMSFRRRSTELGILRAMGMSRRELTTLALFDLATVMSIGLVAAVTIGLAMSRWFIPVLVDTPPGSAPELLPAVAWSATFVVAACLFALLALSGLIVVVALRRLRSFEEIRLGET